MEKIIKMNKKEIERIIKNNKNPYDAFNKIYYTLYGEYMEKITGAGEKLKIIESNQKTSDFVDQNLIKKYGIDQVLSLIINVGFRTNNDLKDFEVKIFV